MRKETGNQQPEWMRNLSIFAMITTEIFGFTGGGMLIGYLGMKYLGLSRWIMIITIFTGLAVAMVRIFQVVKKVSEKS